MNTESEKLHKEIMDWYGEFLKDYYKKENAPVEFIDRGMDILKQYQSMLLKSTRNGSIAKILGRPLTSAEEFFVEVIRMQERDTPKPKEQPMGDGHSGSTSKSPLKVYADFWDNRLSSIANHRNT